MPSEVDVGVSAVGEVAFLKAIMHRMYAREGMDEIALRKNQSVNLYPLRGRKERHSLDPKGREEARAFEIQLPRTGREVVFPVADGGRESGVRGKIKG